MSLTHHLSDPRSRISRFMAAELPGEQLFRAYSGAVRGLPTLQPSLASRRPIPWPTLGTAVDTRIRTGLGETAHRATLRGATALEVRGTTLSATPGHAQHLDAYVNAASAGYLLLEHLAVYARQGQPPLTDRQEDHAARLAIVAARFENIYRAREYHQIQRAMGHFTELRLGRDSIQALTRLTNEIPRTWADDIRRQNDAAMTNLARLRQGPIAFSPHLEGARDVGDAEPDLVAGGTLIDIKATITPDLRPSHAIGWFHQLAGYLLLDYSDRLRIHTVGFYLSRQQALITWPVREFLNLMGARAPLPVLRLRLKTALTIRTLEETP